MVIVFELLELKDTRIKKPSQLTWRSKLLKFDSSKIFGLHCLLPNLKQRISETLKELKILRP